jgi:hypothetical protein
MGLSNTILVLAAATLVAAATPAWGDEVLVPAGQSVQAAIEAAAPNAVIRLGPACTRARWSSTSRCRWRARPTRGWSGPARAA